VAIKTLKRSKKPDNRDGGRSKTCRRAAKQHRQPKTPPPEIREDLWGKSSIGWKKSREFNFIQGSDKKKQKKLNQKKMENEPLRKGKTKKGALLKTCLKPALKASDETGYEQTSKGKNASGVSRKTMGIMSHETATGERK